MRYTLLLLSLFLVSCGPLVPSSIDVNVKLDISQLEQYFSAECKAEYPSATDAEIELCTKSKIGEFLSAIAPSPSSTP